MPISTGVWQNRAGLAGAVVAMVLTFVIPVWIVQPNYWVWGWAASAASLLVFCVCIGIAINGRLAGLVIDARNKVSLSKLQAAAWTILILSGWIAFVVARARLGASEPEGVDLPPDLLAVMGISATSLVAAPVILSLKAPDTVHTNDAPGQAQWLDLFRGDDVGNANSPDLGKIQQFLITVVVLAVYAGDIWNTLLGHPPLLPNSKNIDIPHYLQNLQTLPKFSPNLTWLIGISHAGYLAYKAAPHPGTTTTTAGMNTATPDDVAAG